MKCKVFVINLDKSTERMDFMHRQLQQLDIAYERVAAVYGKDLDDSEITAVFNEKANLEKYDKVLNVGELGCYLSHVNCWKQMVEQQIEFALILEDDSRLDPELGTLMDGVAQLEPTWDYIKLCHSKKEKGVIDSIAINDKFSIGTCLKLPASTRGQFVSLAGAKKLLATALPISRPIDVDIQYWFEKNINCFVVRPFPVVGAKFESEITILGNRSQTQKRPLKRILQKMCFEAKVRLNRHKLPDISTLKS
ncbi:glycosyltransferase family 25 protein [Shewanella intestini]|uniref:Glycosyltransferase family 25 protein n=1 Tax=Shewanella intestini TaxID=2017544 RepID=A0ABS5I3Z6_9GAMM|nr:MULTISPECIES: glycosyltransferase family 25 protein [Shewanella]MBR9728631.1 glycosyltransferase family 25 protein [Shewanella intestini]MRG37313.1 glycosyl transferase [Shewanella sp. XMDDZSB0408]